MYLFFSSCASMGCQSYFLGAKNLDVIKHDLCTCYLVVQLHDLMIWKLSSVNHINGRQDLNFHPHKNVYSLSDFQYSSA